MENDVETSSRRRPAARYVRSIRVQPFTIARRLCDMMQPNHPILFHPSFETIPDDEGETQEGLTKAMLSMQRQTHADTGRAHRAVHAKAHGYLRAKFEVLPNLPTELAQGLYAKPGTYDAVLRFSTTPGDVLDDQVSTPRGVALKVLGVPGPRLPGSEHDTSQNYVLGNAPSFQAKTAASFLTQLKPLAAATGKVEPLKHAFSVLSRTANSALAMVGQKSGVLTMLAGQPKTHLLGDSFFSQAAILHGEYYGKVALSPISSELTALSEKPIDLSHRPDAIRETVQQYFRDMPAVWELRVQLATSLESMPIEDAAATWEESESPYRAVARVTAAPQDTWSDSIRELVEDHLAFDPWIGLAAHRPLGSIMRARQPAYAAARAYRAESNKVEIREPKTLPAG